MYLKNLEEQHMHGMNLKKLLAKRREKGLTLIEASMVLALSAVVVAGVMLYYQSASDNNRLQNAEGELGSIQSAVQTIFAGQSNYQGLTTTMLAGSSSIPPNLQSGSGINFKVLTPWNSPVTVVGDPGTPWAHYTITYTGVPQGPCVSMGSQQLGSSLISVGFNGKTAGAPSPSNASNATTGCSATVVGGNTIAWLFK